MDWTLAFIITIVGSITLSITANLITDPIKKFLARKSMLNKQKRIDNLKTDLESRLRMHNNMDSFYASVIIRLFKVIRHICFAFMILLFGYCLSHIFQSNTNLYLRIDHFTIILSFYYFSYIGGYAAGTIKYIKEVIYYDAYEKAINEEISDLIN